MGTQTTRTLDYDPADAEQIAGHVGSSPLGPSPHFPPRLNQGLNRARRRDFVAVELAPRVGAPIGVHHCGDAHRGELLSQLSKLGCGELVVYGVSLPYSSRA